jgi:hypothetical protein
LALEILVAMKMIELFSMAMVVKVGNGEKEKQMDIPMAKWNVSKEHCAENLQNIKEKELKGPQSNGE